MTNSLIQKKHRQPKVFYLAYFTTLCERFGFYIISYLFVFYAKSAYALSDAHAFILFGAFTAFSFLTPALGGYIADNFIGIRRCIILGLFFEGTGLVLASIDNQTIFFISLALIIIGVGLFKTAPTDLLARSYKENDARIDSGFTLYYMAINIGTLFSTVIAGIAQKYFGWHVSFLIAGIGLYLGLIFYFFFRKSAAHLDTFDGKKTITPSQRIKFFLGVILACGLFFILLKNKVLSDAFFAIATLAVFGYFAFEMIRSDKNDRLKIIACLYLILVGFAFSVVYFQAFTSIALFVDRNVARNVFGLTIPTVTLLSLNAIFVILLGPILSFVYNKLEDRKRDLSVVTKLTLGLLIGSLSLFCIGIGSFFATAGAQISWVWIAALFFFYTIGDLMNSALGVAMVTHIAPKRMYGVMMGAWFFIGNALAADVSGVFAGFADIPSGITDAHETLNIYVKAFTKMGIVFVIISIIAFMINPVIKKIVQQK